METESYSPKLSGKCSTTRRTNTQILAWENCKNPNAPRLRKKSERASEERGRGREQKPTGRRQRRLRSVTGMAHFLASSNAELLAAEGGEFCGEVVGGIHVGVERTLNLNYKEGS